MLLTASIFILCTGCASHQMLKRNEAAGHDWAMLFLVNTQGNTDPTYPANIAGIETQLKSKGIENALPKCECQDHRLRDFVYVGNFDVSDERKWPFLFSPPEMSLKQAIVVSLDAKVHVVSREVADDLLAKSQVFTANRHLRQ